MNSMRYREYTCEKQDKDTIGLERYNRAGESLPMDPGFYAERRAGRPDRQIINICFSKRRLFKISEVKLKQNLVITLIQKRRPCNISGVFCIVQKGKERYKKPQKNFIEKIYVKLLISLSTYVKIFSPSKGHAFLLVGKFKIPRHPDFL